MQLDGSRATLVGMLSKFNLGSRVHVTLDREMINVTSSGPTPNESWRFTDAEGHEHYYDHGYPTLVKIVDASHWCDGSEGWTPHEPHEVVDTVHYECKLCWATIVPAMDPPFMPKFMPGQTYGTIRGVRDDGLTVTAELTAEECATFSSDPTEATGLRILNDLPLDRCLSIETTSR